MDAGAIVFRIQMAGAQVFQKDAADAQRAQEQLGRSATEAGQKEKQLGDGLDQTGTAAKKAKGPLDDVGKSTKKAGDEADGAGKKTKSYRSELTGLSSEGQQAAREIGGAMFGVGAAVGAMVALSVVKFAEFDEGMSRVSAASNASEADLGRLKESAIDAGAASVFNARQAADAQTELAKAGQSVNDILAGGLTGSLALAAAGELEIARAAEIAATTLSVFNLEGEQTGHVADLLAAGAGKAQGSVDDLALALGYVGPTFARLNIPLESTVGSLALLASRGILGEKAGTGLRATMQSLTAPTALAARTMEQYGINVFDAQGKFIGMGGAAEQLKARLGGLDEQTRSAALGAIFGSEAANVAGTLYEAGAAGVQKWTDSVNDQGYAAEQAYRMTDNLTGDIEQLGGAFDSALIKTGSNANDTLRGMVQILTLLVDWYSNLPGPLQATALGAGVVTSAVLLSGGAFLLAVPKIAEYRLALQTLQTEMPKTAGAVRGVLGVLGGPWGIALLVATSALVAFGTSQAEAQARAKAYGDTLDTTTGKITENSREMAEAALSASKSFLWLEGDSAFDSAERLGLALDTVTDAALDNGTAYEQLMAKYQAAKDATNDGRTMLVEDAAAWENLIRVVDGERGSLEKGMDIRRQVTDSQGENAEATESAAEAYLSASDEASGFLDTLTQLVSKINESNDLATDAVTSNASYQAAIGGIADEVQRQKDAFEEANGTLAGFTLSLDENSESGSANAGMLAEVGAKARDAALAQYEVDKTTMGATAAGDKYFATLGSNRKALEDAAVAAGFNADQVQLLTDKVYGLPTAREVQITAETAAAQGKINRFITDNDGRRITIYTDSVAGASRGGGAPLNMVQANGGVVDYYANGGVSERHVAQIARASSIRVWAEPETGGEAYIPLSPAKRARSLQIWRETGHRLGVEGFAEGGFYDQSTRTTATLAPSYGTTINGDVYTTDVREFRREMEKSARLARMASRGRTNVP